MHTVTVTLEGAGGARILLGNTVAGARAVPAQETATTEPDKGPSPIAPEPKELLWGLGAFVVFLVLMRLYLFPKVKKGMDARYGRIKGDHESAVAVRADAERELGEYHGQIAQVKVEVNGRLEAARQQLETERAARLAEVNEQIAERRAAAVLAADRARAEARGTIEAAATDVASRAVELSIDRAPDRDVVQRAVADVMSAGVH